jgi:hypothetical protein
MNGFDVKGVAVAALIAFSSFGCASADVEETGQVQQRATVVTQPLPVSSIISTYVNSGMLTFVMASPYVPPLHVATIVITRKASGPTSGTIIPGADTTHGGSVLVSVDPATFTALRAQAMLPFRVVVSYDTLTNKVVQLEIVP